MGLDMYLYAKRYVWDRTNTKDVVLCDTVRQTLNLPDFIKLDQLRFEVGYWRKANHIHKWFVDNVQQGEDDCGYYDVYRDDLIRLKKECQQVLENKELASEILPTQAGFFFGSKDYDEWYFNSLKETVEIIDRAISLDDDWSIQYSSSW